MHSWQNMLILFCSFTQAVVFGSTLQYTDWIYPEFLSCQGPKFSRAFTHSINALRRKFAIPTRLSNKVNFRYFTAAIFADLKAFHTLTNPSFTGGVLRNTSGHSVFARFPNTRSYKQTKIRLILAFLLDNPDKKENHKNNYD